MDRGARWVIGHRVAKSQALLKRLSMHTLIIMELQNLAGSPVDHVLSELSTMSHLSWVALHGMAHSFIELDKISITF